MTLDNKRQEKGRISKATQNKIEKTSSSKYPSLSPKIEKGSSSPTLSTTSKSTSSSTTTSTNEKQKKVRISKAIQNKIEKKSSPPSPKIEKGSSSRAPSTTSKSTSSTTTSTNDKQKKGRIPKAIQNKIDKKSSPKYPSPSAKIEKGSSSRLQSTSSSITTSTDYRESIKSKDEFKVLSLYDNIDFSTEEVEEEEGEDKQEIETTDGLFFDDMSDFLKNFEAVSDTPNVKSTNTVPVTEKKKMQMIQGKDTGYFVDPLTGTELHSTSSSEWQNDSEVVINILSSETESNFDEVISYQGDVMTIASNDSAKIDEKSQDISEKMLQLEVEKVEELSHSIDLEAILKEYYAKKLKQEIDQFITELIDKVVKKAEYITPEDVLRRNLDKRKLILELAQTYYKFEAEKLNSEWLQRKVTQFFYHQKTYNFISPDPYQTLPAIKKKYKEALRNLDKQLAREARLKEAFQVKKNALLEELEERKAKVNNQISYLEDFVRESLTTDNRSEHISKFISLQLRSMDAYRKKINKTRLKFILEQDTYSQLKAQLDKLENLGNGLSITNYEHLLHQNCKLEKKLEERSEDLYKLHSRINKCNHILAHYKEKQNVLRDDVEQKRTNLQNLLEEKDLLRRRLNELKLTHVRLHGEFKYLNYKGGLVNNPLLMYDYDQTVESSIEKRDTVARLRATKATIESRINRLENRFSGSTKTPFNSLSHTM